MTRAGGRGRTGGTGVAARRPGGGSPAGLEAAARRPDAILAAVARAAELLLAAPGWADAIGDVLAALGRASAVSRVYVFENRRDGGGVVADQRSEWVAEGVSAQIDNPEMQGFDYEAAGYGDWAVSLAAGEVVQARCSEVSDAKRALFDEQAIKALLLVPVAVGGAWWGFIGFDDCSEERTFSAAETEALRAAAGILGAAIERERAGRELADAEARYRMLVEQLPTVIHVSRLDENASSIYMSPQVEALLGYPPEDWLADPDLWEKLMDPRDRARVLSANRRFLDTGEPFHEEYRMRDRAGRVVWIREETVMILDEDGRPRYAQGIMLDISAEKLAEDELRQSMELLRRADRERRHLLAHIVRAQEEERTRIAADIHDDPLQKVTAIGMRLGMLHRELTDEGARRVVADLEATVSRAVKSLRDLLFDLRPPALDERGLVAALEELLDELAGEAGWRVEIEDGLTAEPPPEARAACYRIAQEAITNIHKHAGASRVHVRVRDEGGGVAMSIRDDGAGFDPDGPTNPGHLGLTTMHERASLAGGRWSVVSAPGRGTRVELWIPSEDPRPDGWDVGLGRR